MSDKTEKTQADGAKSEDGAKTDVKTEVKVEAKSEVPALTASEALRQPDGKALPGVVVKEGDLVRCLYANMTDNLTKVSYDMQKWGDAVPSKWLDGQLAAGKIEVK